jgi:CLIP-associating protein 1/2
VPLKEAIDKFPLRPFLPSLVDQLSDADPGVREAARSTCINLFSNATAPAKSELKREMEKKGVRKQTADAILAQVLGSVVKEDAAAETKSSSFSPPQRTSELPPRSASRLAQTVKADDGIDLVYIASQSDLDRTMTAMLPHFAGKETEHNWLAREQSVIKVRGMLRTGVHDTFYDVFLSGLKNLHEGILKATASLRTTLSMHALQLISELAQRMREGMDSLAEPFMSSIIKMAGFTKKIVASASQAAIRDILLHVSYRHKFLDLLWQNLQEKTVTTRAFMCGHLITLLQTHGLHRKHILEGHGGLDIIERFCKKALPDQNKDVREKAREALYLVERIWPAMGANIIDSLDSAIRKQVESNRGQLVDLSASTSTMVGSLAANAPRTAATPNTTPRRGPNGPSSAIVAAKRAAALRLAQERRNQEEAEGTMSLQDEREGQGGYDMIDDPFGTRKKLQREADDNAQTHRLETDHNAAVISFPPITPTKSPLRSQVPRSNGYRNSRSLSPSAIPQPVSPRRLDIPVEKNGGSHVLPKGRPLSSSSPPSGHNALQITRPRTSSTSSSSSVRSTGRLGSTATPNANGRFESFGQRVGQTSKGLSTPSNNYSRVRTISTASSSSAGQRERVTAASPSLRGRNVSLSSSTSSRHLTPREERDETVQLDQVSDASMDLMSGKADAEYQNNSFPGSYLNNQIDGIRAKLSPLSLSQDTHTSSELKTPSSTGRSRLPRPVSVIYSSPSPVISHPSKHAQSRSVDKSAPISPTLISTAPLKLNKPEQVAAGAQEQAEKVIPSQLSEQESERTKTTSSAVKWFLGKASRLDNAQIDQDVDIGGIDVQLSPIKKRPESETYISQLQSGQADLRTFKGLARICKEFKLPYCNDEDDIDEEEQMLQPGQSVFASSSSQSRREEQIAMTMWQQGNLFERLYSALSSYLCKELSSISKDLKTAALIVLHRLVENQFKLLKALGKQRELIQLIFDLIRSNKSSSVKSACQAIMESWSEQTNVVIGISTLRGILSAYLGSQVEPSPDADADAPKTTTPADSSNSFLISIHTLSLRSLSRLFQRLPVELIEDEVQRCKSILKSGLNHWNIETRQQAVAVLVAANSKVNDPKVIFNILQPMERAQEDLLMYFMSRAENV